MYVILIISDAIGIGATALILAIIGLIAVTVMVIYSLCTYSFSRTNVLGYGMIVIITILIAFMSINSMILYTEISGY